MAIDLEQLEVQNNEDRHRFETHVGEQVAYLEYMLAKEQIVYTHTEVPENLEGQGIASRLAQTALEYAQEKQLKVLPLCPYIRRHPEYKPLLRPGINV